MRIIGFQILLFSLLLGVLGGCLSLTDDFYMPPDVAMAPALTHTYAEYRLDAQNPKVGAKVRDWLLNERVEIDDDLLLLAPGADDGRISGEVRSIWAEFSDRDMAFAPAPDAVGWSIRLYRRQLAANSCYNGAGQYLLGCAVKTNRQKSRHRLNPQRHNSQKRAALYETVPDGRAITFQKPAWLKPREVGQ